MPSESADINRTLGLLLGKVDNIEKQLTRADEGRSTLHRRMDDLVDDVGTLRTSVAGLSATIGDVTETVTEVKRVTDDVTRWKQMGVGALFVTGIGASAVTALVTTYWAKIVRFFTSI